MAVGIPYLRQIVTRWDSLSLADENTVAGKMGVVLIAFASLLFGAGHKPGKFQVRWAKPHAFKVRWAHPHQRPVSSLGRILEEERAPLELLKIARVESGFDTQAFSPKGA